MKPTPVHQKPPVPGRHVIPGDELYFNHEQRGVLSGRVASVGQHGVTVDAPDLPDGQARVRWEHVLGHKARRERKLTLIERGEDGAIAEDEDGKRVFVAGELPDEEGDELNKAIPVEMLAARAPVAAPLAPSLLEQAQIDCALIAAGYEPTLDYIKTTYGVHWSKASATVPPVVDLEPIIKSIAEVKAHGDASLSGLRSEFALALAVDSRQKGEGDGATG